MRIHHLHRAKGLSPWSAFAMALLALNLANLSVYAQEQAQDSQEQLHETVDPLRIKGEGGQALYDSAMYQLQLIAQKQREREANVRKSSQLPFVSDILKIINEPSFRHDALSRSSSVDAKLQLAVTLLEEAASVHHHDDALYTLADMNFYAKYNHPRNYTAAYQYYSTLASRTGNATAQQHLGFMYATGIGDAVERDQAKALIYHTFASFGGDVGASLTLGYRYLMGIGTEQSCADALYYYREVANKVMEHYSEAPPGGPPLRLTKLPIWDDKGGLFGSKASSMTSSKKQDGVSLDEILHMYHTKAESRNDPQAQIVLGQIYYQGSSVGTSIVQRNMKVAFKFFNMVAKKFFPDNDDTNAPELLAQEAKLAGKAAGMLGRMYRRGDGVQPSLEKAKMWFMRGTQLGDPSSANSLGEMFYTGALGKQDLVNARVLFKQAAELDYDEAQVNLATLYFNSGEMTDEAMSLLKAASHKKNLRAMYMLANIYSSEASNQQSCVLAVTYYKMTVERGDWLYSTFDEAYNAYMRDDYESAALYYMLAAEKGFELAQSNVAWLLDDQPSLFNRVRNITEDIDNQAAQEHALIYWTRAANQNNVEARVKMGDCYYHGIGTSVDYEKAASCYQVAAEMERSSLAMWNLGWMYENGIGTVRDFHLAKRWYDSALHYNREAYLVVKLSLIKLHARYYWNYFFGRDVGRPLSSGDDASEDEQFTSWTAWWTKAIKKKNNEIQRKVMDDNRPEWDIGDEGEHLARQYDRHRRQNELDEEDSLYEGGNGIDDEDYSEEDELVESLMILALCVLVGWLVYVRQFRFQNPMPAPPPADDEDDR
ncbi:hypothetical protein BC943DRAFT_331053 [Umbelopsis sp. AD052]|nr:hypothetical protein BC943DRAFT_331053 [Umbelopsis sp. AD052]